MPTVSFQINSKCSGIIRVPGVQITTLDGRLTGNNVNFNTFSYDELQMRRKGEILQYKGKDGINTNINTKKQNYANIVNNRGQYSQARLNQIILLRSTNEDECPIIKTPSSNSGIRGDYKTMLYNDVKVPLSLNRTDNLTLGK
jgi:hypothetical protein